MSLYCLRVIGGVTQGLGRGCARSKLLHLTLDLVDVEVDHVAEWLCMKV